VITENGIADLYGKTLRQRAAELVRIAHPNHQENIEREYYQLLNKM
jgi:acyl-CoA hydrolase